jgi:hypothetical protein
VLSAATASGRGSSWRSADPCHDHARVGKRSEGVWYGDGDGQRVAVVEWKLARLMRMR